MRVITCVSVGGLYLTETNAKIVSCSFSSVLHFVIKEALLGLLSQMVIKWMLKWAFYRENYL